MGKAIPGEGFIRDLLSHQNTIYAYILTLVLDPERARDLLQDTSVEMWSKAGEFTEGTNFLAWACRVAYYKVLAYRRDRGRERLVFGDELLEELAQVGQQQAGESDRRLAALDECLGGLKPFQQELIRDRYQSGKSVKQIAAARGRSAQGLAVTLHRIRQALVGCVEKKLGTRGS